MAVPFLSGAIEGFYGQPWTNAERVALFDWMAAWGLNTYLYAPKDDLKHRALWRELYTDEEAAALRRLIEACDARGLHFIFGLSPGLDIRYGAEADRDRLLRRFDQLFALGCRHFSVLFDDTPDRLEGGDADRWNSLAAAQTDVANAVFTWIRSRHDRSRFVFCPTAYCGRMAQAGLGGPDYLSTVGRELRPEIDIFWTGPEIISREIPLAHVRELGAVLRRKPLVWDNLHANDYDGRRFFCGPYSGRPLELREEVSGLLSNPNNELPLNFVPLRTLAAFVGCHRAWHARSAYLSAMQEWLPHFATIGGAAVPSDLIRFGDCYYLPHEEGPKAVELYHAARRVLSGRPGERANATLFIEEAARLRDFCARLTELCDRPLFHALARRAWNLREELDLLTRFIDRSLADGFEDMPIAFDSHRAGPYRGGMVARLQALLEQRPDGTFVRADTRRVPPE
jgi:hypothetical protein